MAESYNLDLFSTPIPIYALNSVDGINEENEHLSRLFGRRGVDWEKYLSGLSRQGGFWFERVHIYFRARSYVLCFDITPLMLLQGQQLE